ncbi:type II toxin-antitoxin system RelE/ParE family toxin [Thiofilum flexile]|uniref:type II toxin-antitoxin system RelE/ParE family toxin n=1 Tax=Thiofilum flexile TaxID=125627 RepID=UPI00036D299A|nr:type II toxin-antitoxin system RelE/ParE family toxin [Thiofilum flexile]
MEFIETPTFTRQILALLSDEEYRGLQNLLIDDPERGNLIKGGGGIRKIRYSLAGQGKSGGMRAIYYWLNEQHQIYMLLAYPKSAKDTLTDRETAILRELVKEL